MFDEEAPIRSAYVKPKTVPQPMEQPTFRQQELTQKRAVSAFSADEPDESKKTVEKRPFLKRGQGKTAGLGNAKEHSKPPTPKPE